MTQKSAKTAAKTNGQSASQEADPKPRPENAFGPARAAILEAALQLAPFDGWTAKMMRAATEAALLDRPTQEAAFPGGVSDLLRFWSGEADAAMRAEMEGEKFKAMKIREKVTFAVRARIDVLRPHKEAARRAAATLALPHHGPLAASLAWKTADEIWRGLADKSTDFNFYSKRAILTGVWTTSFARWLADDSEDEAATNAFLDARIENVMQVEKLKARIRKSGIDPAAPWKFFAGLRYPRRG